MAVPSVPVVRVRPVVSVSGMARAVGMSRSRFYDHIRRGVFPTPAYSPTTKRPYYTAEVQEAIVAARQTGIGCNGEYVVFYERSASRPAPDKTPARNGIGDPAQPSVSDLVARLGEVGLMNVSPDQVRQAIGVCFPNGTTGQDEGSVLRAVNRYLRRPTGAR